MKSMYADGEPRTAEFKAARSINPSLQSHRPLNGCLFQASFMKYSLFFRAHLDK
jgi:hypothetical protein